MGRPRRRIAAADWGAVGTLLILPGLFFWQGLTDPASIVREDAAYYYQPYYTFAAAEVQAGRLPLWNPYSLLGIPFHAGLQASLFYPLRWPLFWVDYVLGYVFLVWTHYFLTGLAAYLLLRVAVEVRPLAGLLGAISITFGGFTLGHMSHLPYVMAYPWFLACFLCVWLGVRRSPWPWTVGAGGCIGLLGLIGAVHLLLILGVLLATFAAFHTICQLVRVIGRQGDRLSSVLRPTITVGGALVLGAIIAAVQLLPAYSLARRSTRQAAGWEYINMACAHPARNSLQLVVPFYFGNHRVGYWGEYNYHGMAHYTGMLMLLAAMVGLSHLGHDRYLWFLLVLAVTGFLLGAGKYLPVYRGLYDWIPGFAQLRNPTRLFWCTDIALACLAAVGLDRILARPANGVRTARTLVACLGGSVIVLVVLAWAITQLHRYAENPQQLAQWVEDNPNVFDDMWKPLHITAAREAPGRIVREWDLAAWTNVAAAVVATILVPVLALRRKRAGPFIATGLLVLLIGDLFATSLGNVQYEPHYRAITETPPRAQWLQQNLGQHRYVVLRKPGLPTPDDQVLLNRSMQFGLRYVHGVGGGILESAERGVFCKLAVGHPKIITLAGARYVLADNEFRAPRFSPIRRDERYYFYENVDCLPLVYPVQRVAGVEEPERMLPIMLDERFNPHAMAVVCGQPPEGTVRSQATKASVKRVDTVPGRWEIEVGTDAPVQLVILEGFAPGWRGWVNGQPASILQTNDRFMSLAVPAGRSNVLLEYAPPEFGQGAAVSVAGLALAGALLVGARYRRRTTRATKAPARPEPGAEGRSTGLAPAKPRKNRAG